MTSTIMFPSRGHYFKWFIETRSSEKCYLSRIKQIASYLFLNDVLKIRFLNHKLKTRNSISPMSKKHPNIYI